ncbi:MAG TPA: hypothetical protein PLQ54_05675, partial [Armatimonadota bacterium]|nr:hypothetical protein [Armatimonadota bacterium]
MRIAEQHWSGEGIRTAKGLVTGPIVLFRGAAGEVHRDLEAFAGLAGDAAGRQWSRPVTVVEEGDASWDPIVMGLRGALVPHLGDLAELLEVSQVECTEDRATVSVTLWATGAAPQTGEAWLSAVRM